MTSSPTARSTSDTALAQVRLGRPPVALLVPAVVGTALLVLPLLAMVAAVRPAAFTAALASEPVRQALVLSLWTSTVCMAVCLVLGLPLAWLLARRDFRGRTLLRAAVTVPMVLPPVVAGVALREAFGRSGLFGAPLLEWTGFAFPYTPAGVVLAHTFVSLPFVVLALEGALRAAGPAYDAAAASLGASTWTIFRRITLPLAAPGIAAAMMLGWARSLGEFGATITFNGSYPGTTQTMPTLIYQARQSDQDAALALSVVMLAVSLLVLLALRDRWWGTP
ncbi:molybdate ABC transporter permease subunit [Nocardioides rotundus]|uniref:molybdate ABC transporter permease subunit n=1 Tax=Nocardioides rotundus TaxID=1774216 RepID=UPI001CBDA628|nr:molybdate ABC transporter permease subunit [Nocardioides rotundus]